MDRNKLKALLTKIQAGFTLIELMTVVTIIGILASVAIPNYSKYIKKAKTAEATFNIRKIYDGEIGYFQVEKVSRNGAVISVQFVNADPQPANVPTGDKVAGNWEGADWNALNFSVDSPVLYRYQALAGGTGTSSSFTVRAEGDLDSDTITSLFERTGYVDTDGNPIGSGGLYSVRDLE